MLQTNFIPIAFLLRVEVLIQVVEYYMYFFIVFSFLLLFLVLTMTQYLGNLGLCQVFLQILGTAVLLRNVPKSVISRQKILPALTLLSLPSRKQCLKMYSFITLHVFF